MVLSKIYENFFQAIDIFKKDKIILMLSLIPIGIGSFFITYLDAGLWWISWIRLRLWVQGFIPGYWQYNLLCTFLYFFNHFYLFS